MKLYYNSQSDAGVEIRERMKSMSLAFTAEMIPEHLLKLEDGKEVFQGENAIAKHLDQIAGELHNWYYCNC
ncbi:hypothetical protein [Portibacter lacus]|uniref:Uncharacterized protein n=1 Tax=Portibacter lacus TaxID=1099794 RepID=A0AA37SZ82_9BACT|nr:hypothetical protein [Portibacter lacus]GLR20120.1 hypothetical protein GCM10007940_47360 [Portibacter lacus]